MKVVHVHRRQGDGVVMGTIKLAGFIVALLFLIGLGTCVYVCGSATSKPKDYVPPPRPADETWSKRAENPTPPPEDPKAAVVRNMAKDTELDLDFVSPNEIRLGGKDCSDAILKQAIAKIRPARLRPWGITRLSCVLGFDDPRVIEVPQ